jgi:uncharacterized circularly permuted ATP-grasp superfamily protein/uncharacterized alpha-E superfamily protein
LADTPPPDRGPFLSGYTPLPGVPDEAVAPDGTLRPLWARLAGHLDGLAPDQMALRMARADQYMADSGVFYRQYGGGGSTERPWPLSHLPVLIGQDDWDRLSAALVQRADLLEAVMADLYGPGRLVETGRLPPSLVAGNPEWLRPMVGIAPRSGHYLHFLAFELGRGPDGNWWVLADRAQAPSGAGYALENRVATARAFSGLYADENVHRLAGFFRAFRDALLAQREDRDARVAILTPGPLNETYFEHAWLARYLGITLVQGEDLTVQGARLMVRTVAGLRPVEVLWRRLDGSYADPMELDHASRLGTPGLVSALRAGGLSMVNALGSGVLETRALMAFLPKLAPDLVGAPLLMPNIATWWCGDPAAAAAVLAAPDRMILSPALATGMPFDGQESGHQPAAAPDPGTLAARLPQDGARLVAQEAVTLSTTPALVDGRPVPRPMTLRVFLARTGAGWAAMPGGFARIGASPDAQAIAMQRGGSAADVWVVSPGPVPRATLAPVSGEAVRRGSPGALPARSADNLFWLGRYVERAESAIRLLRAWHIRLAETGRAEGALLDHLVDILGIRGIEGVETRGLPQGVMQTIASALMSASQVRDSFSVDGWMALTDLERTARGMSQRLSPGDDAARAMNVFIRKITGFSGLVHENMYHSAGWRFLSLGRSVERAMSMTYLLADLTGDGVPDGALDVAIEVGDSVMTHRRRFAAATARETVIDLLALDRLNPRAVLYQIDQFVDHARAVAHGEANAPMGALERAMLRLQTDLATADPAELDRDALLVLAGRISDLATLLAQAHLR